MSHDEKLLALAEHARLLDPPTGLYVVNARGDFVACNGRAREILGLPAEGPLPKSLRDFYFDWEDAAPFPRAASAAGPWAEAVVTLNVGGREKFVKADWRAVSDPGTGEVVGFVGCMSDVTREELYSRLLHDAPVGLYVVRANGARDVITDCNEQFARLLGFDGVAEVVGQDAKLFYASRETYEGHMKALGEGGSTFGYALRIRTRQGVELIVEDNSRVLSDGAGKTAGRVGALRDITQQARLRQTVEELTEDIGAVLHSYSAALVKMQNSLRAVLPSLGPDPFVGNLSVLAERASAELEGPSWRLAEAVNGLLDAPRGPRPLPEAAVTRLRELAGVLQNYKQQTPYPELHPPVARAAAEEVLKLLEVVGEGGAGREALRRVGAAAREVLRVCNLISLHQLLDLIVSTEYPLESLRDFITAGSRWPKPRTIRKVSSLISQSVTHLNEFAALRGVELRYDVSPPDLAVEVFERDIIRAFDNLLHNAIKYSWERSRGQPPYVLVKARAEGDRARVSFQNWGVPIPADEIKQGLIFRMGFRGRLSGGRGRIGTGIGLADALRMAREHGGDVSVESVPAVAGGGAEDYSRPFLTTVTLSLPLRAGTGVTP